LNMKILLVTPMPPQAQAPGAIPLVLYARLTALLRRHQVTLVTPIGTDPGEAQAAAELAGQGIEVYAPPLMGNGVWERWQRRGQLAGDWLAGHYPWRTAWFRSAAVQQVLDELLATERYDVVQIEDNAMAGYTYRTQTPAVLAEYEVRQPRRLNWQQLAGQRAARHLLDELDWQRWSRYQKKAWARFDRIEVFTQRDAEAIGKMAPDLLPRVSVNPFGVMAPPAADPAREDEEQILFVGNYTHAPNVDAALWLGQEIMPRLRRLQPGVQLKVVGIYPPDEVLALGGSDIVVTGPVPQIEPWLERAAVVVAPLRIGGGMRMKVLHAMAMGKAVVTTPRGAEGLEIDGHHPPLVVAADADALAAAVAALLADAAQRRRLGADARAFVLEHFSPDAHVRRLENVYAGLLAGQRDQRVSPAAAQLLRQKWKEA
jgi:polysaccharide biosynthesis protein PslH